MTLRSNEHAWGAIAKAFHWLLALAILGNGVFGLAMDLARGPMQKIQWLALHKSIGLTVLALMLLRLAWRGFDRRPREAPMPAWQRFAARTTHAALYVLALAIPLTGWWFNSVAGKPLQWFKQFNLPALAAQSDALVGVAHAVHKALFLLLALIVVLHVAAAVRHHLADHDVLRRMLPFGRPRRATGAP